MSSNPRPRWSDVPSTTSRASTIIPAQVASVASPPEIACRSGASSPVRSSSIVMVVLSPPGSTIPSSPSRSSRERTRRVLAPLRLSALTCSAKAPCIARTPMRGVLLLFGLELPASGSEELILGDGRDVETMHRLPQSRGDFGQDLRLVVVCGRRDDRLGTLQRVLRLEDARPDEDSVDAELHHQRGIRGRRDPARGKVDHRQPTQPLTLGEDFYGCADLLGFAHQLRTVHALQLANAGVDRSGVADGLDHVAGPGLTLGADHRGAFGDPASRLTQIAAATHERNLERMLVNVVLLVGR